MKKESKPRNTRNTRKGKNEMEPITKEEWIERALERLIKRHGDTRETLTPVQLGNLRGWAEALYENRDPEWPETPEDEVDEDLSYAD